MLWIRNTSSTDSSILLENKCFDNSAKAIGLNKFELLGFIELVAGLNRKNEIDVFLERIFVINKIN